MSILTSGSYFFSQEKIPISPPNQPGEEMVVPEENPTDPLPAVEWYVETLDETPSVVTFKMRNNEDYLAVSPDGGENPPITTSTDAENAAVIIAHRVLGSLPNSYAFGPTKFVTTFPPHREGIIGLIKLSSLAGEDYNRVWQLIPVPL